MQFRFTYMILLFFLCHNKENISLITVVYPREQRGRIENTLKCFPYILWLLYCLVPQHSQCVSLFEKGLKELVTQKLKFWVFTPPHVPSLDDFLIFETQIKTFLMKPWKFLSLLKVHTTIKDLFMVVWTFSRDKVETKISQDFIKKFLICFKDQKNETNPLECCLIQVFRKDAISISDEQILFS